MLGTSDAAESIGMRTMGVRVSFDQLANEVLLPCIAHWRQNHFIVVYKIKNNTIYVADPAHGLVKYTKDEFMAGWASTRKEEQDQGLCLLLEPTPDFYKMDDETMNKGSFRFLFSYLRPYKKFLVQLTLGMLVGSLLQLVFPFLTQAIVDFGINNQDIAFITLILVAQLALFVGRTSVEFIRSWILLHVSTRINISLISDFLIKMMKLPIGFFDTKMIGDILQRIGDHRHPVAFLKQPDGRMRHTHICFQANQHRCSTSGLLNCRE